jgi:hypothetical protein
MPPPRRSLRLTLLAAVLTAAFVFPGPVPAAASARGDWWRAQAITALGRATATGPDSTVGGAFYYAHAAYASALLYGWNHAGALALLAKLRALRNPDGGYGVGRAWDAFQDGTTNPADTTYVVTVAGHAGPVLLSAYQAGLVPRSEIQALVDVVVRAPRVPVDRGQCVAYSTAVADAGRCVHNVSAGAARFLQDAARAGFGATGMHRLITDVTIQELVAYREAGQWWPYLDDGAAQDADHNAYSAASMYRLAYWVGREAVYRMMTTAYGDNGQASLVHAVLTATPGGVASLGLEDPTTTLWCELGDRWRAEQSAYLADVTGGDRAAQFAAAAALNAKVCG